jgi:phage terminase small subunit
MKKPKTEVFFPEPPPHLSEKAKTLWQQYAGPVLRSPGQLALLQSGLEALDRADQARELIAREGMTIVSERGKIAHQHPALNILKEAESTVVKIWRVLNLNWPGKWQKLDDLFND